jgi:phosphoserine phosphatase RsbU/P
MNQTHTNIQGFDYAFHLTSLLDLSSGLHKGQSAEELLGTVLLSMMGRLKTSRSCVLLPKGDYYLASVVRGFPEFSFRDLHQSITSNIITEVFNGDEQMPPEFVALGIHTTVPLVYDKELLAVLCLGKMASQDQVADGVIQYLSLVKMLTTIALHNANIVNSLMRTSEELRAQHLMVKTMFEISRDFTSAKSKRELLRIIGLHLMGRLVITSFALFFTEPINGEQVIYAKPSDVDLEQLLPEVLNVSNATFVADMQQDLLLTQALNDHGVELVAPMLVNGVKRGVVVTRGKLSKAPFAPDDLVFLEAVGNTAMTAIDNERLVSAEIQVKSELAIALEIQRDLMPLTTPKLDGLDVATFWQASRTIGGDYFDVIPISEGRTLFAVADVAGKGVPAALLMANTQSALTILAQLDIPLTEIAHRLNTLLCENTKPEVFVTVFLAIVDMRSNTLSYVTMGHNPPVLLTNGRCELLEEGGLLAGVVPDPPDYVMGQRVLAHGDVLILYTDGVTECQDSSGKEFGVDRLTQIALQTAHGPASDICNGLVSAMQSHCKAAQAADDTTIMVIKVI